MDTEPTRDPNQPTPEGEPTMPAGQAGPPTEPLAYSYAAPPPNRERRRTFARLGIAGGVAALGLTVGGIAVATADDEGEGPLREFGRSGVGEVHFSDELAERLAESLGVDEDAVADALEDVRDELGPDRVELRDFRDGERPEPPTDEEIEERQDAVAAALAEALDVDKADVEAALEEIRADVEAEIEERLADARVEARADLVERLDAAVEDGTLTEADKESVLKAYDEGVIGGPGGHVMGGGPFGFDGPFGGSVFGGADEQPSTNS